MLPDAHWIDLLVDRELVRLLRDPGRLTLEVEARPAAELGRGVHFAPRVCRKTPAPLPAAAGIGHTLRRRSGCAAPAETGWRWFPLLPPGVGAAQS